MARNIEATGGAVFAEALSFALARNMPRPEAQNAAKALARDAADTATPLATLARRAHPDLALDEVFDPAAQMGTAPAEARAFATAARASRRNP